MYGVECMYNTGLFVWISGGIRRDEIGIFEGGREGKAEVEKSELCLFCPTVCIAYNTFYKFIIDY